MNRLNKRISLFVLIIFTLSLFGSSPKPVNAQIEWWNNNWSYKITIEIDGDKIEDDFTDFPVLVYLNSSRINWAHVQDDLDDLRFINADEITQLYAELENYTVNSEAWIWVKIPVIYSMGIPEFNQVFYLYYGNPSVSSWWNPEDVWDSSAVMVQHMYDNPDTSHIMDSTSYSNDGTKKRANEPIETVSGKIDSAQIFDGLNDKVECGGAQLDMPTNDFTISAWIKMTGIIGAHDIMGKESYNGTFHGYSLCIVGSTPIFFTDYNNYRYFSSNLIPGIYAHLVVTITVGNLPNCYFNGILNNNGSGGSGRANIGSGINPFTIGYNEYYFSYVDATIDEVRVYNVAKSAEWIKADYYSSSNNLLLYGAESLVPLTLIIRYNIGINKLYINNTQIANNTTIYIDQNTIVNATAISQSNYIFYRHILGLSSVSLIPIYLFNMTQPFTLWSYATPNFYIYEEPTTFTFSQWMILLFLALGISLLAAIKFHIIATVSLILVLYMIINVASYTGMILLAIIVWLLTIMFSIIAFGEI